MKISVVIPIFPPHVNFLEDSIKSLEKQTYKPDEIIIALSETNLEQSNEIINNIKSDLNIIMLPTTEKQYAGQNRNRGALIAKNEIICFIDVDDESHPQKLEIVKHIFEKYDPNMFIHRFLEKKEFTLYNIDDIEIVDSSVIFNDTFGNPPDRKHVIPGGSDKQICVGTQDRIHHGHVSVNKRIFNEVKYNDDFMGQDAEFCRSVLWKYNNTLYSSLELVNFKFDKKNHKRKEKWYKIKS